jgi:phosphopantothenoylcysteine decarboxylase/phosphopantothenate--cysteine ligase
MRILITAGPTREHLDSVRFLSNPSSGKLGFAIASAARARDHEVVLISGPVLLAPPDGVEFVPVVSAAEMLDAAQRAFPSCEAAVMVAAVCDYRPVQRAAQKLPKQRAGISIELEPTEDICATLGAAKQPGQVVVGFALEDHDHHAHAEAKLRRKHCDAIVLNDTRTLEADAATIEIYQADGTWLPPFSGRKDEVAGAVVALVERLLQDPRASS